MEKGLVIWTNVRVEGAAGEMLRAGIGGGELVEGEEGLRRAEVAFGGPAVGAMMMCDKLRWVHVTSAGYTAFDRVEVWGWLKSRGVAFTNSSEVYAESCAEHLLAMMLGLCRELPPCVERQRSTRGWSQGVRGKMQVLEGSSAILYGYGAIGKRLAELVAPFRMEVVGVRRRAHGDEAIPLATMEEADAMLGRFDHVVNILPANDATRGFFDAGRFARMKAGARFYNMGRGTTVVQRDLIRALESGQVGAAYLDVTDPEPLTAEDPLWSAPNCWITPHIGGGYFDERERMVRHFLGNLRRFENGEALMNRVV